MTANEIKQECSICYEKMKDANNRLKYLRSICKHENVFEGIYEYRIAASFPAIICSDCGEVVQNLLVIETDKN